jgi:hypothetical protein
MDAIPGSEQNLEFPEFASARIIPPPADPERAESDTGGGDYEKESF